MKKDCRVEIKEKNKKIRNNEIYVTQTANL